MNLFTLIICGISLAMDAFAVTMCKGFSINKIKAKDYAIIGLKFGFFKTLMMFIGYILSFFFKGYFVDVSHTISFVLLAMIGSNMIKNSMNNKRENIENTFDNNSMFGIEFAISVDALAVGVTFALQEVNILLSIISLFTITFTLSSFGLYVGHKFGEKYSSKAEMLGGIVLVLLGVKILFENLF